MEGLSGSLGSSQLVTRSRGRSTLALAYKMGASRVRGRIVRIQVPQDQATEAVVSLARFEGLQDDSLFIVPLKCSAQQVRAGRGDGRRGLGGYKKRSRGIQILELHSDMVVVSDRAMLRIHTDPVVGSRGGAPRVFQFEAACARSPTCVEVTEQGDMWPWEDRL
ncbi:hypothetical protein Salat_1707200 [Sesamum alatum]|uniref:Uncharacterized protein n=1 Tax=Sesamum alatum TaxID=300844 RepID=A0AAE2CK45_9LAMI|nr:hypothetical protein Salat_1707200 [Sesamum alatum]